MEDYILDKDIIKEWIRKLDNDDEDNISSEISDFMEEKIERYLETAEVPNDVTVEVHTLWHDGTAEEFRECLRIAADENSDIYLDDFFEELVGRIS